MSQEGWKWRKDTNWDGLVAKGLAMGMAKEEMEMGAVAKKG